MHRLTPSVTMQVEPLESSNSTATLPLNITTERYVKDKEASRGCSFKLVLILVKVLVNNPENYQITSSNLG